MSPGKTAGRALQKVDRGTLHDRVYHEIRRGLLNGTFAPGSTMSLQALADRVGTSIMPVRDALRRLVIEHALDLRPNRMILVPILTAERLNEVRDLRLALESMAGALSVGRITERDLEELTSIAEKAGGRRELATANDLMLDQSFYFTIYRAAGRPIMLSMIDALWLQIGPLLSDRIRRTGKRLDPQHHHAALAALRARNAKAAGRAIAAAVLASSELMIDTARGGQVST
ncbi:MAG: GntR family transcriptional regulator [Hypericibacter sp.]